MKQHGSESTQARHRIVLISPDKNTDYCYLNMTREQALERFHLHEDWLCLYEPAGVKPQIQEIEFVDSFMLWRNIGGNMADILGQRGAPPEVTDLLRGPGKPDA